MVPLSLLSLPFFLLSCLSLAEDPIHIGLQRRNRLEARSFDYVKEAERLRDRYGYSTPVPSPGKRATASIPITNQNTDSSYLAFITIGTPPQQFSIVLDTGSTDLWVATDPCASCLRPTKLFSSLVSSTFKTSNQQVRISYGSGQVSGTIAEDTVSMGPFTISGQTFLAVSEVSSNLIDGTVSGIMGLAWTPLASTLAPPFWYNLAMNGSALTSPDMSFWLKREIDNPSATELMDGGIFTLGGINDTLYTGDIEFIPMPIQPPSFWVLGLSGLTVNGSPIAVQTGSSALSAIDTGTTLIGGPSADVAKFWAAIPGSAASPAHPGFYTFPCTTKLSVTMAFGGKSWSINPVDMNLGTDNRGTRCVGSIFDLSLGSNIPPGGLNPGWVVGAAFLKNVYSVFRASSPPSIGFAQLSSAAGGGSSPVSTNTRSGSGAINTAAASSDATLLPTSMIGVTIVLVLGLFNVL